MSSRIGFHFEHAPNVKFRMARCCIIACHETPQAHFVFGIVAGDLHDARFACIGATTASCLVSYFPASL